jgi:hypothetical protein
MGIISLLLRESISDGKISELELKLANLEYELKKTGRMSLKSHEEKISNPSIHTHSSDDDTSIGKTIPLEHEAMINGVTISNNPLNDVSNEFNNKNIFQSSSNPVDSVLSDVEFTAISNYSQTLNNTIYHNDISTPPLFDIVGILLLLINCILIFYEINCLHIEALPGDKKLSLFVFRRLPFASSVFYSTLFCISFYYWIFSEMQSLIPYRNQNISANSIAFELLILKNSSDIYRATKFVLKLLLIWYVSCPVAVTLQNIYYHTIGKPSMGIENDVYNDVILVEKDKETDVNAVNSQADLSRSNSSTVDSRIRLFEQNSEVSAIRGTMTLCSHIFGVDDAEKASSFIAWCLVVLWLIWPYR